MIFSSICKTVLSVSSPLYLGVTVGEGSSKARAVLTEDRSTQQLVPLTQFPWLWRPPLHSQDSAQGAGAQRGWSYLLPYFTSHHGPLPLYPQIPDLYTSSKNRDVKPFLWSMESTKFYSSLYRFPKYIQIPKLEWGDTLSLWLGT